jgi:hypothetical protein
MGPGKQCYILPVGQVVQIKMAAWRSTSVEGTTFLTNVKAE